MDMGDGIKVMELCFFWLCLFYCRFFLLSCVFTVLLYLLLLPVVEMR
jgi:hypothetical protein